MRIYILERGGEPRGYTYGGFQIVIAYADRDAAELDAGTVFEVVQLNAAFVAVAREEEWLFDIVDGGDSYLPADTMEGVLCG